MRAAGFILVACLVAIGAAAESDAGLATKAKFIFQVTQYGHWPETAHASPHTPLVIGVLEEPQFVLALQAVAAAKTVPGRRVEVISLDDASSAAVHLLFLPKRGRGELRRSARQHQDGDVPTVSDEFDFAKLGGDLGIELIKDRISFSINRRKVNRGDFAISSKLMCLASEVK